MGTGAIDRKLNVRVDFFFIQYNKSSNWQIGISWPGHYGGGQIGSGELDFNLATRTFDTAVAKIVNQPLPGLDLASQRGWVKVLKQATVITTNGNEAHFSNGGGAELRRQQRLRGLHPEDRVRHQPRRAPPATTRSRATSRCACRPTSPT